MLQDSKKNNFSYKDEELILQFQQGNENAYVELVNRYKNKLINFTFNFLMMHKDFLFMPPRSTFVVLE